MRNRKTSPRPQHPRSRTPATGAPSATTPVRTPRREEPRKGAAAPRTADAERSRGGLWLYGTHAVLAAAGNPARRCHRLLLTAEARGRLRDELAHLRSLRPDLAVEEVADRNAIEALLSPGAVHQGIALSTEPLPAVEWEGLVERLPAGRQLVVVLDQVSDPHNVGAILRSAACFGAAVVLNTERQAAAETGTLAKAASGALEHVPYQQVVNLARSLDRLKALGFWIVGLAGEAPTRLDTGTLPDRLALCLGAEGPGLRRLTRERCDLLLTLPAHGPIRDLNVSNAAAVALYELLGRGR